MDPLGSQVPTISVAKIPFLRGFVPQKIPSTSSMTKLTQVQSKRARENHAHSQRAEMITREMDKMRKGLRRMDTGVREG